MMLLYLLTLYYRPKINQNLHYNRFFNFVNLLQFLIGPDLTFAAALDAVCRKLRSLPRNLHPNRSKLPSRRKISESATIRHLFGNGENSPGPPPQ
jgi:hypothetical protein